MTKYNVYERIILSDCEPINTKIAIFYYKKDADSFVNYKNKSNSYRNDVISKYYYIHSESE